MRTIVYDVQGVSSEDNLITRLENDSIIFLVEPEGAEGSGENQLALSDAATDLDLDPSATLDEVLAELEKRGCIEIQMAYQTPEGLTTRFFIPEGMLLDFPELSNSNLD